MNAHKKFTGAILSAAFATAFFLLLVFSVQLLLPASIRPPAAWPFDADARAGYNPFDPNMRGR